ATAVPAGSNAQPTTVRTTARTSRAFEPPRTEGASAGRRAASGATRVAPRAGANAARTVTTTPATSGTRTTAGVTSIVRGSGTPRSRVPRTVRRTWTPTAPTTMPVSEARVPSTPASVRTDA